MWDPRVGRPLVILVASSLCIIVGLICGGAVMITTITPYLESRDWTPTNATISYLSLESYYRGGRRTDIVRCRAIYSYIVGGHIYKGTNVSLVQSDPLGYYQEYLCASTKKKKDNRTALAYYDPGNITRSVLNIEFAPGLLTLGITALTVFLGVGVMGLATAAVRLKTGRAFSNQLAEVRSEERDWSIRLMSTGAVMLVLLVITLPISLDSVAHGMMLSLINLAIALVHLIILIFCTVRICKKNYAGLVILPADEADSDTCCVKIPSRWDGECEMKLYVAWVKETNLLLLKAIGKTINLVPSRVELNEATKNTEISFSPAPLPDKIIGSEIIGIRITGKIGEKDYKGTFLVGEALKWKKFETRQTLGLRMMGSHVF